MKKVLLPLMIITITIAFLVNENRSGRIGNTEGNYFNSDFSKSFLDDLKSKAARKQAGQVKRFDEPDQYVKYHAEIRTRDGEEFMAYKSGYRIAELEKLKKKAMLKGIKEILPWVERGPANVPGRTRGLIVDPDDPAAATWFAGSVGGGIWKTTNEGASWTKLTPDFPNLATTVLAMAPSNSNVIYAGTGEGFFAIGMVDGDGIFKSTDKGDTWNQLASTAGTDDFQNVNRIIVDPDDENILLACTNTGSLNDFQSGIYKSEDGGQSWRKVYSSPQPGRVQQLIYHPSDFNIQYAAVRGQGVLKSTDAGETWVNSSTGMSPDGRVEIAIAPSNPNRLFASAEGSLSGNGSDLYVTDDAGASWSIVRAPTGGITYDFLGGQGWFDNTIAVDPYDDKKVYIGGVNIFRASMRTETGTLPATFIGMDEDNSSSFIELINFGGSYYGGRLDGGSIPTSEFVSVEVRFGPGKTQKAHRFTVPPASGTNGDGGAGVPPSQYQYQDYADVPFEVWDITNNRQLMVSFRDQERDGKFDLEPRHPTIDSKAREYIFIHAIPYSASANSNIAVSGGHTFNQMYFFWPVLPSTGSWDENNLPESLLRIRWGSLTIRYADFDVVSDAYNQFSNPGKNSYGQTGFHPDQHNLVMIPVNQSTKTYKILVANDGGVFLSKSSTEPGLANFDFIFKGQSYNTTQFYGADKRPGSNVFIGGSQDNGTWFSPAGVSASKTTNYTPVIGGDGFEVVWHYKDPLKIIGGSQYNGFRRTINGGGSWTVSRTGLTDVGSGSAPFITRLANSKSNPDVLFAVGASGVWRSYNFAESWRSVPIANNWAFGNYSNVRISVANYNIVWAGGAMRETGRIFVSKDGGHSFTATNNYTEVPLGRISGIGTHPTEDSTAYVLFSYARAPKILRTTNLGQSWEDISGFETTDVSTNGFPDVAVYTILPMPYNPEVIWAGTEIGIVESTDNGATWELANNGLPAVSVWELKVVDDQIVAATHGRGIWSVTIPEINRVPFITEFRRQSQTTDVDLFVNMRVLYDSVQVFVNKEKIKTYTTPSQGINQDVIQLPVEGAYNCYVISWIDGTSYKSASNNITSEIFTGTGPAINSGTESLNIYPNPSDGLLWFELPGEGELVNVELYSLQGQKMYSNILRNEGNNMLQLPSNIGNGVYVLIVRKGIKMYSQRLLLSR
jgi:photosystem II stability/assembly factor-like uncharacterized protein